MQESTAYLDIWSHLNYFKMDLVKKNIFGITKISFAKDLIEPMKKVKILFLCMQCRFSFAIRRF
jgi:hypothetical protein